MDAYFRKLGPFGQRMMRQSSTVQVCLDFGVNDDELARRFLVSQILGPVAAAIFAYSPFVDGRHDSQVGCRSTFWRQLDDKRTGFPALDKIFSNPCRSTCVRAYTDWILAAPVLYVEALNYSIPTSTITFREWISRGIQGVYPNEEDLRTHLSLLFPEVRPKGFLELRSPDCQAKVWQGVPAAFLIGILYNNEKLDQVLELLLAEGGSLRKWWQQAAFGLKAKGLRQVAQKVALIAFDGFKQLPVCYRGSELDIVFQAFIEQFVQRGRVPGDDLVDAVRGADRQAPTRQLLCDLEEQWQRSVY